MCGDIKKRKGRSWKIKDGAKGFMDQRVLPVLSSSRSWEADEHPKAKRISWFLSASRVYFHKSIKKKHPQKKARNICKML